MKKKKTDIAEFEKKVADAALEEWAMLEETKFAVSAISQVRQIKLFCIIKNILDGIIPSEYDVALIFIARKGKQRQLWSQLFQLILMN